MTHTAKNISVADFTAYLKSAGWKKDPTSFIFLLFASDDTQEVIVIPAHKCYEDFDYYLNSGIDILARTEQRGRQEIIEDIVGAEARNNPLQGIRPADAKAYLESIGWVQDTTEENPNLMIFTAKDESQSVAVSAKEHFIDFYPILENTVEKLEKWTGTPRQEIIDGIRAAGARSKG